VRPHRTAHIVGTVTTLGMITATFVAVSDPDLAKAEKLAAQVGCSVATSFEAMVSNAGIDAEIIAAPTRLRAVEAMCAARAGKAVLCEKAAVD
jgi:predicted dehydrogenase